MTNSGKIIEKHVPNLIQSDYVRLCAFVILMTGVIVSIIFSLIVYTDSPNTVQSSEGGTGFKSYSSGQLLVGNQSGSLTKSVLTSGKNISVKNGDGSITISLSDDIYMNSITANSIITNIITVSDAALTGSSDVNVTITLGGKPSSALLNNAGITLGWQGTLGTLRGGTGINTYVTGDMFYASGASTLSIISANSSSTQKFLSQTSNSLPSWEEVSTSLSTLSSSVGNNLGNLISLTTTGGTSAVLSPTSILLTWTGELGATLGGTGIGSYTQGDMLYANTTTSLAKITGNITTSKQFLTQTGTGTISAQPVWGGLSLSDVSGSFSIGQGIIGIPSFSVGSMFYASGTTTLTEILGNSSATQKFLSQTSNGLPSWEVLQTPGVGQGGTGQTMYTDGQLLIGNTTGGSLTKATITGTTNQVNVTNGAGSITLSLPQDASVTSNIEFNSMTSRIGITCSTAPLSTNASNGFLYIPIIDDAPTGIPVERAGTAALVYHEAFGNLYVYNFTKARWTYAG